MPIFKLMLDNLEKWTEEKKKESENKLKLIETEIEIAEAESELEGIIKDMDDELKRLEKEEEKKTEMELEDEDDDDEQIEKSEEVSPVEVKGLEVKGAEVKVVEVKGDEDDDDDDDGGDDYVEDEDDDDDDDDENAPSSFGSVIKENNPNGKKGGKSSPFAASSLRFASLGLVSMVPSLVQQLFVSWKQLKLQTKTSVPCSSRIMTDQTTQKSSIGFERTFDQSLTLRTRHQVNKCITRSSVGNPFKKKPSAHVERNTSERKSRSLIWPSISPNEELGILSLHIPI